MTDPMAAGRCAGSGQPFESGTLSTDGEVAPCPACHRNSYVHDDGTLEDHHPWERLAADEGRSPLAQLVAETIREKLPLHLTAGGYVLPSDLADAVLAALQNGRWATVKLPEPAEVDAYTAGAKFWEYPDGEITVHTDGDYEWRSYGINHDDPSRLRDAAGTLLAAAAAVERGEVER